MTGLDTSTLRQRIEAWRINGQIAQDNYMVHLYQGRLAQGHGPAYSLLKQCLLSLRHPAPMKAFIEGYGVDRFLADWPQQDECEVVTYEATPAGRLVELKPMGYDHPQVWLVVTDTTTGSRHVIRVAPELRSVHDALAWSFGLDPKDYQPAQES